MLKEFIFQIQSELETFFDTIQYTDSPQQLYEPINYIMGTGGKRIRALLTVFGYLGYQDDHKKSFELAYCVELFHNFTLVHDDIMDQAPLRRGHSTVHEKYDVNTAILSGDVMLIYVFKKLSEIEGINSADMIKRFCEVSTGVCEGQALDMEFENRKEVDVPQYLDMIEKKTAILLGLALQSGALLGGANQNEADHLFQFGKYAGIAFQLHDDFLDLYGETTKVGKQLGGDIIQKKRNFFYVKAIDLLEGNDRTAFINKYTAPEYSPDKQVKEMKNIFNELYLKNYLDESKNEYLRLAFSHLDMTSYNDSRKNLLTELIQSFIEREQ